jgi:DNA-binding NarL/FixJ family response regulator
VNTGHEPTTVMVVDDHALVREGLCRILATQDSIRVVAQAGDSVDAVAHAAEQHPDIVILDIEIPGGADAATTVRQILDCSPGSRVIILSMYEGPHLVNALLAAGVRGYLLKSIHWEELVVAIRAVATDHNRIVLGVSRSSLQANQQATAEKVLSQREREILTLVEEALSNRQIAHRLSLTETTVKRHLRNIYIKLGAVSRLDAVKKAQRQDPTTS